jgi:hypothetical protein
MKKSSLSASARVQTTMLRYFESKLPDIDNDNDPDVQFLGQKSSKVFPFVSICVNVAECCPQGFNFFLQPALCPATSADIKEFVRRLPEANLTMLDEVRQRACVLVAHCQLQQGFSLGHYLVDTDDDTLRPIYHVGCLKAFLADPRSRESLELRDREVINTIILICGRSHFSE